MLNFYLFSYLHLNFKMSIFVFLLHSLLHNSQDRFTFQPLYWICFFCVCVATNDFFFVLSKLYNTYLPWTSSRFWHSWWPSFLKTCLPLSLVALCFQCQPPSDHFTVEFVGDIFFIHMLKTALLISNSSLSLSYHINSLGFSYHPY